MGDSLPFHLIFTMTLLYILDIFAELIHLVFDLGVFARKHIIPAVVYLYVAAEHYIFPAFMIPYYYVKVRQQRLASA